MTMNNDEHEVMIRNKLDFYLTSKVMCHIKLYSKRFYNAIIVEKVSDSVYIINEQKLGLLHIFVVDIFDVSDFMEEGA